MENLGASLKNANWKYISIVLVLSVIVGGGFSMYQNSWAKELEDSLMKQSSMEGLSPSSLKATVKDIDPGPETSSATAETESATGNVLPSTSNSKSQLSLNNVPIVQEDKEDKSLEERLKRQSEVDRIKNQLNPILQDINDQLKWLGKEISNKKQLVLIKQAEAMALKAEEEEKLLEAEQLLAPMESIRGKQEQIRRKYEPLIQVLLDEIEILKWELDILEDEYDKLRSQKEGIVDAIAALDNYAIYGTLLPYKVKSFLWSLGISCNI